MFKRKTVTFIIILVSFLLQATIFSHLTLSSVRPNLLLVVTSSYAFMRGKREGMCVGFACGIFADIFWGPILGFHTFIFVLLGFICGSFRSFFYYEDLKLPLLFVTLSELLYGVFTYVFVFLLRGDFSFLYYLGTIILPETIYTVLITLVLYQIILVINRKLETEEQRSASKFV